MDRSTDDPLGPFREVLAAAHDAAAAWLTALPTARVAHGDGAAPTPEPLPEVGVGAAASFKQLVARSLGRAVASAGPRYFHYVVGGVTPAALAADWWASTLDQVASSAQGSPLAIDLEELTTRWLIDLFQLGSEEAWTGVLTTGATAANFVGMGAARQWWGEARGVDVGAEGLCGLPRPAVLTSGFVHASVRKALAMLGLGRRAVEVFGRDNRGTLDLPALQARLGELDGPAPAILIATAGDVNSGRFDPIDELADLAEEHGAWLHVDGAFGLFARAAESTRSLCRGAARAHSIATDAHKWLNVPYDSGVAFVRSRALLAKTFRLRADYLPKAPPGAAPQRVPASLGPESSRRARALPIFATLLASGRSGVAAMVERHVELARFLAELVRGDARLELIDEPVLNVVVFRVAPPGVRKSALDALNEDVGRRVLEDGRVYVGTTRYRSRIAFRPAIANWRTSEDDLRLLLRVIAEALDAALAEGGR